MDTTNTYKYMTVTVGRTILRVDMVMFGCNFGCSIVDVGQLRNGTRDVNHGR